MYERFTLMLGRALTLRVSDLKRQEGQAVTEYGLVLAFVAIALLAIVLTLKGYIGTFMKAVGDDLSALPGGLTP